ncbi:MAG: hypothetical protein ACI9AR_000108 [Flavobacteriaceae bacterium]|jgi:hypothetical protein
MKNKRNEMLRKIVILVIILVALTLCFAKGYPCNNKIDEIVCIISVIGFIFFFIVLIKDYTTLLKIKYLGLPDDLSNISDGVRLKGCRCVDFSNKSFVADLCKNEKGKDYDNFLGTLYLKSSPEVLSTLNKYEDLKEQVFIKRTGSGGKVYLTALEDYSQECIRAFKQKESLV